MTGAPTPMILFSLRDPASATTISPYHHTQATPFVKFPSDNFQFSMQMFARKICVLKNCKSVMGFREDCVEIAIGLCLSSVILHCSKFSRFVRNASGVQQN